MSLLQMSFSGAVMILAIIVIRALAINKLPKKVFVLLWEVVLLRLLIPFSIPSMLSAYSIVRRNTPIQEVLAEIPTGTIITQITEVQVNVNGNAGAALPVQNDIPSISIWLILWIAGVILCAIFFAVSYLRCYFEFRTSLPVCDEFAVKWLGEHQLKRSIQIRQSDRISAPLTYGILSPVILMPKKTDWKNSQQLQYVLLHEYTHICRFDIVLKLIAILALCIHWFNPFVWVMYILFNRDIELACDESVVRQFGESSKSAYARTLITMEEKKSGLTPLYNNFSRNAIEERITAIMKTKKITIWALIISVVVLIAIVVLFATSAERETISSDEEIGMAVEGIEVPDIVLKSAMQLVGQKYADMQAGVYNNWRIEALVHAYTYDDLGGMTLQIYRMNYEFFADDPEKVTLVGGMTMDEDGWVVPEYANSTYLVFQQEGEALTYLTSLMENDCFPGDEVFTEDLKLQLSEYAGNIQESSTNSTTADDLSGEKLVYVEALNGETLAFDEIEWVTVPSERATELGVTEDDAPSGFYAYNEAVMLEELSLAENCICKVLNWTRNYEEMEVSMGELADIFEEREGLPIPYRITVKDNEIVAIAEKYVP